MDAPAVEPAPPSEPLIVNKGELAGMFRVSVPTIDVWLRKGCPFLEGGSNGVAYKFDFESVKSWRTSEDEKERAAEARRQAEITRRQGELFQGDRLSPEGTVAEMREALEAERLAIIVSRQKGELLDRNDVRNDYAAMCAVVRQHALGWASTLGRAAGLTVDQQKEADKLARGMLVSLHGAIKDPAMRPDVGDGA